MNKLIAYILIVVCLSNIVYSYVPIKEQIYQKSKNLKGNNDLETIVNIHLFVENYVEQQYFYSPRYLNAIWIYKKGDCTDKAQLKRELLKYHNIKTRYVHGYLEFNNTKFKHDWIEYYLKNEWLNLEYNEEYIGVGFWK